MQGLPDTPDMWDLARSACTRHVNPKDATRAIVAWCMSHVAEFEAMKENAILLAANYAVSRVNTAHNKSHEYRMEVHPRGQETRPRGDAATAASVRTNLYSLLALKMEEKTLAECNREDLLNASQRNRRAGAGFLHLAIFQEAVANTLASDRQKVKTRYRTDAVLREIWDRAERESLAAARVADGRPGDDEVA